MSGPELLGEPRGGLTQDLDSALCSCKQNWVLFE
jgi:hypothetical protein